MALTKIITDTIDLSSDTTALKMPKGTTNSEVNVQYLVVAGGGGGGWLGGGGGAGGYLAGSSIINGGTGISYNVTVGSGGVGAVGAVVSGQGSNSTFSTLTAIGGGGGATHSAINATTGGSGGGGGSYGGSAASGTPGQGNDGGANSTVATAYGAGGGGGSAAAGVAGSGTAGGDGGAGTQNNIDGNNYFYAGGGGGGVQLTFTAGSGGSGIGGDGANDGNIGSSASVANRGSGGGGGGYNASAVYGDGGAGSSGIVTLNYPTVNTLTSSAGLYGNLSTGTIGLLNYPSTAVALYEFESNGDSTSSSSNNQTTVGTLTYSSGKFSNAVSGFSGSNYFATSGLVGTLLGTTAAKSFTISAWIKTTIDASNEQAITGNTAGSSSSGASLYIRTDGKLTFLVSAGAGAGGNGGNGNAGGPYAYTPQIVADNKWHHVAATYSSDGTTSGFERGRLGLFVDGINVTSSASFLQSGASWSNGSANPWTTYTDNYFRTGRWDSGTNHFLGAIDQLRIYQSVLSDAQIQALYNETSSATTGTIGSNTWSSFIAGTGTVSFATPSGTGRPLSPDIGTMRENTTTGKMEIYTGAKGWRALQQTGQDVGVVPSNNFNTVKYTGNSGTQIITGFNFKPDLIWIKRISSPAEHHAMYDTVRGPNEQISSSDNANEVTNTAPYEGVTSFNNNGFTTGNNGGTNRSPYDYVSWGWKAGGNSNTFNIDGTGYVSAALASMNTGTITPTGCSVNTEAGFSIVKYTGTGNATDTVSHGLGSAPDLVMYKDLTNPSNWNVYVSSAPSTYNPYGGILDLNYAFNTSGGTNGSAGTPSSTVLTFTAGSSTVNTVNALNASIITYSWRSIPGYSLIGMYTGTGVSTAMPRIYTGFEPAWIMVKCVDSARAWNITDNKRNTTNPRNSVLQAQSSDQEYTDVTYNINFYNDGFQIVNANTGWNIQGEKYIFMCFAS